jgi:phosphoketolase
MNAIILGVEKEPVKKSHTVKKQQPKKKAQPVKHAKPEKPEKLDPMSLAERDLALIKIESQIESKRKLLLEKRKKLEETAKTNEFLKMVLGDYATYYDKIEDEKEKQINTMNMLNNYVKDIMKSGKLTDADIVRAKEDQRMLLQEIVSIRKELDEVIKK